MKKLQVLLGAAIACALFTGCASVQKTITPATVRQGVATGVGYSVAKYTNAVPGVRIGRDVICSAANGTDISPSRIVADIEANGTQLSAESILIINTALLFYTGVWNSYGDSAVTNRPVLKEYLQATCNGITDGLPVTAGGRMHAAPAPSAEWPLVRLPR